MSDRSGKVGAEIQLRGIRKLYGDVVAVQSLDLTVRAGEFLTLLGPSGCGKTTTLRMIGGFEYPTSGSIMIDGQDVAALPPFKRPVNTVFQQYALFPHMTVGKNVGYGLEMAGVGRKERERRVGEALEMVRLPDVAKRKPWELSGGQQQRVALARALINRPKALLLDEPLGALDLKLRKAMQLELKNLNRETGTTFIYVTHDQEEALTMSDHIAVMNKGALLQVGRPEQIYESPGSRFVADFIGQSNLIDGVIAQVVDGTALVRLPDGALIGAACPKEVAIGTAVVVSVRPERVRLATPERESAGNRLSGRVREIVYLGMHQQVIIERSGGGALLVNLDPDGTAAVGDQVVVTFDSDHAVCIPDTR